ncbi:SMP-30/gluconolactonase/LRE family protein [Rhizobium leguminosarum]|uniref:SMP-30/gluconolactonase/LRE family protein n=1 Tax=Rhizobium leguminosarum TaxID=384 RepID=UPI000FEC4920|nr:L-dopachrome tautomerase-related protein [Rhizobium leguminosarum]RWX30883.1 gluconolactonase [Rhizobium leguminosarum]
MLRLGRSREINEAKRRNLKVKTKFGTEILQKEPMMVPNASLVSRLAVAGAFISLAQPASAQTSDKLTNKAKELVASITGQTDERLQKVATFDHQPTGVTVSEDGRIFVNFPRWSEDVPVSVAEVMTDGSIKPYPNNEWNAWRNAKMSEISPKDHFVTVQSVVADQKSSLWVVDPAAPNSEKTVKDGPKLVQVDLKTNAVKKVYPFSPDVAGPASYLNDVRIAPDRAFAYFTDSGIPGGLVVLDLRSGRAWRVLSGDPSTQAEKDVIVETDGKPLRRPDGRQPQFNADSIALTPDGKTLYWKALTGKTMYRLPTDALQKAETDPNAVRPEKVAETEPTDGLWIDQQNRIYLSTMANNGIKILGADGTVTPVLEDSRLRWPDTFAQGPDGTMYVTASHIQDSPWFNQAWTDKNFTLFRFAPPN